MLRALAVEPSHDKRALLLGRPSIHVPPPIEVVIDLRGGADHAAVKEHVEGSRLQVLFGERACAIVLPEDREKQSGNDRIDVDAENIARSASVIERLHELAVEGVEDVVVSALFHE